jgi:hypothetical protein
MSRANHQWHEVVSKAEKHRYPYEENHGGAVHGEHAVEDLRRNKAIVWIHQLDAHDHGFRAGDGKKQQGIKDVKNAQALVIDRGDPLVQRLHPQPARGPFRRLNGYHIR